MGWLQRICTLAPIGNESIAAGVPLRTNCVSFEFQTNTVGLDEPVGKIVMVLRSTRWTVPDISWLIADGTARAGHASLRASRAIARANVDLGFIVLKRD